MPRPSNPFEEAAKKAAELTNIEFASDLSGLTRLTDAEIQRLFPTKVDKERLAELLAIVNSATSDNTKVNRLIRNIDALGGVVIRLVKALA